MKHLRVCFLMLFWGAAPSFSQAPPPPGVTPPDNMRVSPELELPAPDIEVQKEKTAEPSPAAGAAAPVAPVPSKKTPPPVKITVKQFIITGNEIYPADALTDLLAGYLDRPLTLDEIYEAADKITEHYVKDGFSLALTTVPAQKVDKGVITFEVLEGRIGRVYPEDNTLYSTSDILRRMHSINTAEVYSAQPLESALLHLNSLPGLKTKAVIKPGEFYGRSDLIIKTDEKPFGVALNVDNYGRDTSGRIRTTLAAQLNNPFNMADQLQLVALASEEGKLQYNALAYNLAPFINNGPRLFLSYGQADFKVNPVDGRSRNARVNLDQNLRRTRHEAFNVGAGATRILSNVDLAGAIVSATAITYFDISGTYNLLGEKGEVTQMSVSLTSNFDNQPSASCFSGSVACTGIGAKWDVGLLRLQPLAGRLDLLLRVNGAYSAEPLPDTNQFSIGGPGSIRAYPSAEARGESGYAAGADLRYSVLTKPVGLTARVFGDYGTVHIADATARGITTGTDISLGAVGVGFDFGYTQHLTAKLDVAWPTTDGRVPTDSDGSHSLYASVGINF